MPKIENKESLHKRLRFDLFLELHQHIDEVDFERVAKRINQLLRLDGESVRVTKEQCETYYRKYPVEPNNVIRVDS